MVRKKFPILIISILFLFIGLTSAITFQQIFPTTNPFITPLPNVTISTGVHCPDGCSSFTHSWNGTNTTLIDSSTVAVCNMDNRSALGENDTQIVCWSPNGDINGTVVGGNNVTFITNGKYDKSIEFNGKISSYVNITSNNFRTVSLGEHSVCMWFNPYGLSANARLISNGQWIIATVYNTKAISYTRDAFTSTLSTPNWLYTQNVWSHLCVTMNSTNYTSIYFNGVLNTSGFMNGVSNTLDTLVIGNQHSKDKQFNGSIDNLMIFNKSLSASEVNYLYNSNIQRYNLSYYMINSTKNLSVYFQPTSFLCSVNSTGSNFCSASQKTVQTVTLKSNFSTSRGIINNNFYGVDSGGRWGSSLSYIDINNDGTLDTPSDYQWHRNAMQNANLNIFRVNARFLTTSISEGVLNHTTTISNSANVEMVKSFVDYARLNNMTILVAMREMPDWLANKTSGYCSGSWSTCTPTNYSKWGQLNVDYLNAIGCTPDICQVEVWNEVNLGESWLYDLNGSVANTTIRSVEYNKLFNASYIAIKTLNSSYKIGGPTLTGIGYTRYIIMDSFLNNFANQTAFISHHDYLYQGSYTDYGLAVANDYSWIFQNLSAYNSNCSKIYYDEFNVWDNNIIYNQTSRWAMQLGQVYLTTLNSYPANVSLIEYQWAWSAISPIDYNGAFAMVSEPLLNNSYFASYNVTKNFAHLCPAGATVYVTSGDDSAIKQVSCKKGNQYSLIVINTGLSAKNITLNMSMTNGTVVFPYANLVNYEDDTTTYKVSSDGIVQLNVMDSYEILYLYSGVEDGALLRGVFKLNEGSGNTIYDSLQNLSNGVKSGATWVNDGILNTLASGVDYTISTSGLFVVSSSYLFNYMNSSWSYLATWRDTGSTASLVMVDSLGNSTTFLSLLIVISFAVVILTLFKPSVNTNPLGKPHY